VRFRGKVQFDYTGPDDICSVYARRDDAAEDDWLYTSFVNKNDNWVEALATLEHNLTRPLAEFNRACAENQV
jgi:hypothetical protein